MKAASNRPVEGTYEEKGVDRTVLTHKIEFFWLDDSADESALTNLMEYAIQNHKRFIESEL